MHPSGSQADGAPSPEGVSTRLPSGSSVHRLVDRAAISRWRVRDAAPGAIFRYYLRNTPQRRQA